MTGIRFSNPCRLRPLALAGALSASVACGETGKLAPIEPDPGEIDGLVLCGETTYGALKYQDDLDDACRAEVEALLPESASFAGRLIALGVHEDAEGWTRLFLLGSGQDGEPVQLEAWEGAHVDVTATDGTTMPVGAGRLEVAPVADVPEEVFSVAFVLDDSASMRDGDLEAQAVLGARVLDALPASYEASVTRFSGTASLVQSMTADRDALEAALGSAAALEQASTALYDGMGLALSELAASTRPVRLLVLVTDGIDNRSSEFRRSQIAGLVSRQGVAGLVLGALFAEASDLRSMFGERGAFFRSPTLPALESASAPYVRALASAAVLRLPPEFVGASRYRVALGDASVVVRR